MRTQQLVWLAFGMVTVVTLSGGGLAAPALFVDPQEGPILTPIVVTGAGFNPGADVVIEWQTMKGNRVSGSGFAEVAWPQGIAKVDASGALRFEFLAPPDLGGPAHSVNAILGDVVLASADFTITRTATISPARGPFGTMIELHMTGGGWTQYDNIVAVTYDNAYIGYMCSFNTQGNMTTWFPASGGVGLHSIDVYPALYTGPSDGATPWKLPHVSQNDQPWIPPIFHLEFVVTDANGSVPQQLAAPPPAARDDWAPAVAVVGVVALIGAVALELPIRLASRRARVPAGAAAALLLLAVLVAAGGPAQAAEGPTAGAPATLMAAGPVLGLSSGTARPGEPLTVTGSGLPANADLELKWSTVDAKAGADGEKFKGWTLTPGNWSLSTVRTDATGAFARTLATPYDHSGIHQITAFSGETVLASSGVVIVPYFEIAGPTHVKAGEKVTIRGYGLGYEKYSASWNVVYDNRLTGWVSGIESHGNVTFTLFAVGAPGQHFIDIGEGAVGFPYLNLWESPFQNRPPGHLSFIIDGAGGTAAVAAGDTSPGLDGVVLGLIAGVGVGALGVQAVRLGRALRATPHLISPKP